MNVSAASASSQPQSFAARVLQGTIWGQIGKLLETGLTLAFTILVVRQLGPGDYGRYGLVSSVVVVGLLLTSLGINEILGSQIPRLLAEGNSHSARRLVLQMLSLRLGLIGLGVVALVALRNFFAIVFKTPDFTNAVLWICLLLVFTGLGELLQVLFTALLDMQFVTLSRALGMALSIGLAVGLFAWQGPSVQVALTASALGWATVIALTLFRLSRRISSWREGRAKSPRVIRYGLTVWIGNLLNFGLTIYSSNFLLGILTSDTRQVGFYNAAVLPIGRAWTIMVAGMATIMLPTMAEIGLRYGEAGLARAWRAYVSVFVALLIPSFCFLLFYADPLVPWVFGDVYRPVAGLMQVYLVLAMIGTLFGGTATINLFYATGRQTLVVVTPAIGGALDIGLLMLLIPRLGALGAIIADGVAGLVTGLLLFLLLRRHVALPRYPFGLVIKITGAIFGALLTAHLLIPPHDRVSLIISMAVGGLLFIGLCWLLKPLAGEDLPLERLGPRLRWIALSFGNPQGTVAPGGR